MRVLNIQITNQPNGSKSPRYHIIVVRQGETIRLTCLMLNQKLDTQILSVSGDCHKMAGALCITHPLNIFSLNFFNYNIIILPTSHDLQHLFGSRSIFITTMKHHYKFNL